MLGVRLGLGLGLGSISPRHTPEVTLKTHSRVLAIYLCVHKYDPNRSDDANPSP